MLDGDEEALVIFGDELLWEVVSLLRRTSQEESRMNRGVGILDGLLGWNNSNRGEETLWQNCI